MKSNEAKISYKHWSLSLSAAVVSRGPGSDIENAMIAAEFDKRDFDSIFGPAHDHPFSDASGIAWMAEVQYKINTTIAAGLNYTYSALPSSHGFHEEAHFLFIESISRSISSTLSVDLNRNLRVGFGPGIHFIEAGDLNETIESQHVVKSNPTKLGLTFDIALRVPAKSRLYAAFNIRLKKVGDVEIGPFTAESIRNETAIFPKTKVKYNQAITGVGIGVRF